ncbi:MAG TPA: HAMP domain-containing protein [Kofleriaceae bacterium]|jgi:HAMP domain-containing protein|nr:HAMP domain-containing protein [Kofleriaceae bacterium]
MFELIKRKLSLKVSLVLALITIPPMIAAAYLITASESARIEELTISSGKVAAMSGARMYGAELEAGIDAGLMTISDVLEPTYEEIKGFDFGDNPRYHTRYDFFTDRAVVGFEDALLNSSADFLYAVGGDINGYTPTHNSKFQHALTGDRTKDLSGNRGKRKFWTSMHQAAARNLEPVVVQPYLRDTGESAWDVSSPIFVKGRHYGAFRVAVSRDSIAAHKHALMLQLIVVFAFLTVITVGFIFFMLRRSMRPLEHLASLANEISTGEGLDRPIKPTSSDEIGMMAKSLNRLRASLQAAMGRLGE